MNITDAKEDGEDFDFQQKRVRNNNNKYSATSSTNWVVIIFIAVETSKVSIRICINVKIGRGLENHALVLGPKKVMSNPLDCILMGVLATELNKNQATFLTL
jgi:hypothetical protein